MPKQILILIMALIYLTALMTSDDAEACPCGCGAVNAQVLYPGENWKYALGVSMDSGFRTVTNDGKVGHDAGPEVKNTLSFALAKALSNRLSGTISILSHRNTHEDESDSNSIGDPSVGLRWTALAQSFAKPNMPQIQLFGTYKHPVGKSIYDSSVGDHQMNVHSNGFAELVSGVDFWFGMSRAKFGLTQSLILPFARDFEHDSFGVKVTPGLGNKSTLSAGYNLEAVGTALFMLSRESRQPLKINNNKISDSEVLVHSASTVVSYAVAFRKTVGLSLMRTAAFAQNKNTTQGSSIALNYMQAF